MENTFDFLLDFQNIADFKPPLENQTSQEIEYYVEITQDKKKSYRCAHPDCGKTFRFKSEATRHIIVHQKDKPFPCTFNGCNKSFKRQEALDEHLKAHAGDLPFSCIETGCGRRFVSKPALRYHQLRHKNNREFKCDIEGCDKSFLTMSHLKQHQTSGLHCDRSDVSESNSYKHCKTEYETGLSDQSLQSLNNVQWEIKTQIYKDASKEDCMKEMYELLHSTLAENRLLKERLDGNQEVKSLSEQIEIVDPSSFFHHYELDVLDFLNGKDQIAI